MIPNILVGRSWSGLWDRSRSRSRSGSWSWSGKNNT